MQVPHVGRYTWYPTREDHIQALTAAARVLNPGAQDVERVVRAYVCGYLVDVVGDECRGGPDHRCHPDALHIG